MTEKFIKLGCEEVTSERQRKNGTRSFYDPVAKAYYNSYKTGYIRRLYWEINRYNGEMMETKYQLNPIRQLKIPGANKVSAYRILIASERKRLNALLHYIQKYRQTLSKRK